MKNSKLYHPCVERLVFIAGELRQGDFSVAHAAERFEVSRRTVHRDLEFMRDRLRYDFYFDPSARAWVIHNLPTPVL